METSHREVICEARQDRSKARGSLGMAKVRNWNRACACELCHIISTPAANDLKVSSQSKKWAYMTGYEELK